MNRQPKVSPLLSPLARAVAQNVLPQAERWGARRLLIAPPTLADFSRFNAPLPSGVSVTKRAIKGRRVAIRGARVHGNRSMVAAVWPEDAMLEARVPILLCVLNGQLDFRIGNYLLHCNCEHFCLVPAGVPRSDGAQPHLAAARRENGHCDLLWLRPQQSGLECWICHSQGERHWGQQPDERFFLARHEATAYFNALAEEAQARRSGWEKICDGLLVVLFALLLREIESAWSKTPRSRPQFSPEDFSIVESSSSAAESWEPITFACRYVQRNLSEVLTIERVARAACVSRTHFTQRFRAQTGQSFAAYVASRRLQAARELLRDTDWSIGLIARSVGLKPSGLRVLFVRHEGISPAQFRRTHSASS